MAVREARVIRLRPAGSCCRALRAGDLYLALWGLALELGLLAFWAISGVWRGSGRLIVAFFIPTALFLWLALQIAADRRTAPATRATRVIIVGFSALFHVTMLATPVALSNDLYRYYWDGRLVAHGVNPYSYPPAAGEVAAWRDAFWEQIFNPNVPTGYPPLAELLFAGCYLLSPSPFGLRALSAACSLGTAAALLVALRKIGGDERRAIFYAWSPLVALEFGNSGHIDAMAIFLLVLAFVMGLEHRREAVAFLLALGGLVKLYPALLAPVWGRGWGRRAWLVFAVTLAAPWLPFAGGGTPFKGLGIFAARGSFNASLYGVIEWLWYRLLESPYARIPARATVALLIAGAYAVLARKTWRADGALARWQFAATLMGLALLLSPVVHPWYVCWLLAFICLEWQAAWLALSGTVIFARHVYIGYEATGTWAEAWWPRWAVYVPVYALLLTQRVAGRMKMALARRPSFVRR